MPSRAGSRRQGRGRPGNGFKVSVTGGFGLQPVRPGQCDQAAAAIDQVDDRYLSTDRT